jgi:hypothetical protein
MEDIKLDSVRITLATFPHSHPYFTATKTRLDEVEFLLARGGTSGNFGLLK